MWVVGVGRGCGGYGVWVVGECGGSCGSWVWGSWVRGGNSSIRKQRSLVNLIKPRGTFWYFTGQSPEVRFSTLKVIPRSNLDHFKVI